MHMAVTGSETRVPKTAITARCTQSTLRINAEVAKRIRSCSAAKRRLYPIFPMNCSLGDTGIILEAQNARPSRVTDVDAT